jgi:hypothetical protein
MLDSLVVVRALRKLLVLDVERTGARLLENPDGVSDVNRLAPTCAGVHHDWQLGDGPDVTHQLGDVLQRQQRFSDRPVRSHGVAAEAQRPETGRLGDTRGQRIGQGGLDDDAGLGQEPAVHRAGSFGGSCHGGGTSAFSRRSEALG